jgi:tetratricopeptide (TPR) repeat protein
LHPTTLETRKIKKNQENNMLLRVIKDLFKSQAEQEKEALEAVQLFMNERQYQSACELLELLLQRNPDHAVCHWELAQCHYKMGNNAKALVHCEKTRALDPDSAPAFTLLTQLRLPGEDYKEVLERIIAHLRPRTYVEIGVFQGATLRLTKTTKRSIGIDPVPQIQWSLEPNMRVFPTTSDDFFAQHDLIAELGDRRVDLAFIDGMHQFDFALRDFANIERYCNPNSVILIHDCYPLDEESAGREPRPSHWSGDVWRVIVLLKKYRPDLQIHTIGTAPTGLAVIQNLNPESTFLRDNHDRLVEEFLALDYAYLNDDKAGKLNLFINHWPRIKSMVRPRSR